MNSQVAAEAISDGLNWLSWLAKKPTAEEFEERRGELSSAIDALVVAVTAVQRGELWMSRPFELNFMRETSRIQVELARTDAAALDALPRLAELVLDGLHSSQA